MVNMVFIVGQTASGKSSLGMRVARDFQGEIVAVDSRTVYRGLDIGTAKPSRQDQLDVPHHMVDVASYSAGFNVSDFKQLAEAAIDDIYSRGRLPVMVGGSGLYMNALLYDYSFAGVGDDSLRRTLEARSIQELQAMIRDRGLDMPENSANKRYLVRCLEISGTTATSSKLPEGTLLVGLMHDKAKLEERIRLRLAEMLDQGLVDEVRLALDTYPDGSEALKGNIYRALKPHIMAGADLDSCLEEFVRLDLRLAKKQISWFKRDDNIEWFTDADAAYSYIESSILGAK